MLLQEMRVIEIYYSFPETKPKVNLSVFELEAFIKDLLEGFHYQTKHKGLKLLLNIDKSVPREIYTDKMQLQTILYCLLNNAIEFTFLGQIRVSVKARVRQSDTKMFLTFSIEDSGIGFSSKAVNQLNRYLKNLDTFGILKSSN